MSQQTLAEPEQQDRWAAIESRLAKFEELHPATQFEDPGLGSIRSLMPDKADLPILVAGLGAGSVGVLSGLIQSKVSQLAGYNSAYVDGLAGYAIYKWFLKKGGYSQYLSAFGGGILIGAIGQLAQQYGLTLNRVTGGLTGGTVTAAPSQTASASTTPYSAVAL